MKYLLPIMLLLSFAAPAQVPDMEKDTIHINEVVITHYSKKFKLKDYSLRGPCYSSDNLNDASEIITLLEKLPEGELNTINFYFNEMFEAYKRHPENLQARDFELLIYKVNADNTPGERLLHETMLLHLDKDHMGGVEVNISGLGIKNSSKLFVGLKLLGKRTKNDFMIDCLCSGHDKYMTLYRTDAASPWSRRWACAALKVDVNVAVKR
jgi:hypothetical protein